jgi:hypothetical protein
MGFLRLADTSATKKIEHKDGDYIEVRANLSKREINSILGSLPGEVFAEAMKKSDSKDQSMTVGFRAISETAVAMFKTFVVGWSLPDAPTVDNYLALDPEPAAWVDGVLMEHWDSIQLRKDEEGKPVTSASGSRRVTK